MFLAKYNNVTNAAYGTLKVLKSNDNRVFNYTNDKGEVRSIDNVMIDIRDNKNCRWLCLDGRHNSIIATIAEICWVMSGSNELDPWLNQYLKRAKQFSDDGKTWRAGYARIFNCGQVDTVIHRLQQSPTSRQAILSIYDPLKDSEMGLIATNNGKITTADFPCNNLLYFTVRNNKELDLHISARGLDWAWGIWSINYQEFNILQTIIAKILGLKVGKYNVYVNNLHLYIGVDVVGKQVEEVLKINTSYKSIHIPKCEDTFDIGSIKNQSQINSLFKGIINTVLDYKKNDTINYSSLDNFNIDNESELGDWIRLLINHKCKQQCWVAPDECWKINNKALIHAIEHDYFNSSLF